MALLVAGSANAHPSHSSRAEATLNPQTGHLEVSLLVEADALIRALQRRDGRPVDWSDKAFGPRIVGYLDQTFRVTTGHGPRKLAFAGWEPAGPQVWLHFEVKSVGRLHGAVLMHSFLMDVEPSQLNTVSLRSGAFKTTLVFHRRQTTARINTRTASRR